MAAWLVTKRLGCGSTGKPLEALGRQQQQQQVAWGAAVATAGNYWGVEGVA